MARASSYPVLLVDDEVQFLQSAAITLRLAGFDVATCSNGKEVPGLIAERQFGVVILDILMPGISGTALVPEVRRLSPFSQVIMLTAVNDIETAVSCMRQGAVEYLVKPTEKERLISAVRRALDMVELNSENRRLKERLLGNRLETPEVFEKIVTRDRRMIAIFQYIEAIAQTGMSVLIQAKPAPARSSSRRPSIARAGAKAPSFRSMPRGSTTRSSATRSSVTSGVPSPAPTPNATAWWQKRAAGRSSSTKSAIWPSSRR